MSRLLHSMQIDGVEGFGTINGAGVYLSLFCRVVVRVDQDSIHYFWPITRFCFTEMVGAAIIACLAQEVADSGVEDFSDAHKLVHVPTLVVVHHQPHPPLLPRARWPASGDPTDQGITWEAITGHPFASVSADGLELAVATSDQALDNTQYRATATNPTGLMHV